ncbi:hypothetical protein [Streptomyces zagrosensis]|uniref:Uncharacterized protein n=1 Tax=Streptomyces zagrosensis TaxID=1042984 RepID=A0A7W9V203_9ACTN|nr:hypothetical protein [Streptomyces zagrosensis]MBB5939750.1 hypothetical protein [Streptomyces zagrosensis]
MGSQIVAASVADGRQLLRAHDAFVNALSGFDRQSRVGLRSSSVTVTTEIYLDYVASQIMAWTKAETDALQGIVKEIDGRISGRWSFTLPPVIHLVKTTGQEEGRAAYTRHLDTIVLPAGKVDTIFAVSSDSDPLFPRNNTASLRDILIHELFHLVSKNNAKQRKALYELIGYRQLDRPVALPDVPWPKNTSSARMPDLKITNPDAPLLDALFTFSFPNMEPPPWPTRDVVPILMANGPYDGGVFFAYLEWLFLEVTEEGGEWKPVLDGEGRPVTYRAAPPGDEWRDYLEEQYLNTIGRNTASELFHPDEIIAQNFVFSALLPSSDLLSRISESLGRPPATVPSPS